MVALKVVLKINFEDVGGFALLGGICKVAQAGLKSSSISDSYRIPAMKTLNLMGTFFHGTALYYFSGPQLESASTFVNLTGIIGGAGSAVIQLGAGEKDKTHPIFPMAHVSVEMIALGGLIASSVGMILSKEHRSLCLAASFVQLPYWALKFHAEVPHFYERPEIKCSKMPSTLQEVVEEDVLYLNRESLIDTILDIICADISNNNLILAGDSGSGKTALVSSLSARIRSGELKDLQGFRVFKTTGPDIIAGAGHVGDKEKRVKEIFRFLKGLEGRSILFIDEIWQLIGTGLGEGGTTDIAGTLLTEIEDKKVVVIGATTPFEGNFLLKNQAFIHRFRLQMMPVMTDAVRIEIMEAHIQKYQKKGISIPTDFARKIVNMNKGLSLREDIGVLGIIESRMRRKKLSAEDAASKLGYSFSS